MKDFSTLGKLLVVRLNRLGHLPPAQYAAEILAEAELPLLVFEFGAVSEKETRVAGPLCKRRWASPWAKFLPKPLRSAAIWAGTLLHLTYLFVKDGKPRAILSQGLQEDALCAVLCTLFRIPLICHVHEIYDAKELSFFLRQLLRLEGLALRRAEWVIFSDESRQQLYIERYQILASTYVVANCPRRRYKGPSIDLRAELKLPADSILLLYLGGIGTSNALVPTIEAVAKVPHLYFLLVGWSHPPYLEELKAHARRAGVSSRVIFVGEVADKWRYLDNCDLSLCYYVPDNLRMRLMGTSSNKYSESMAAGIPSLISNETDFAELAKRYNVGATIAEPRPEAIANTITSLISNPFALKMKSENGLRLHQETFNYETQFAPVLEATIRRFGNARVATETAARVA